MNTPQEFAALLAALRALPIDGAGAALATLTRTSGSTFRRAGARMLVHADGSLVRGLSAGCPEQDIAQRALEALQAGGARVLRYNPEHNGDVLLEMGCGGELEVLVEPLSTRAHWRFAEVADRLLQARDNGVMATLYGRGGQCLERPRHWLRSDKEVLLDELDELDDIVLSDALRVAVQDLPARHKPSVMTLNSAGGPAELLVERLLPPNAAMVFGVNASALALARLLDQLGWRTTVIDHRAEASEPAALLGDANRVSCTPDQIAHRLHLDTRTFAVVMTHNLERDIEYLQALRSAPLAYLGAVGARRRAARLFEATGLDASRLRTPAGLDIGSETPEEIALAIAAEMLAVANGTGGGALHATRAPIHR